MAKEMTVTFPDNLRVDADYRGFTIKTDQAKYAGGDESAPQPFHLFLASIATCSGIYIAYFCKERDIPYQDIKLVMRMAKDEKTKVINRFEIDIQLPANFPDKYRDAIIRSVGICAVKRTMEANPEFVVITSKPGDE